MRINKLPFYLCLIVFFSSTLLFSQTVVPGGDVYGNWTSGGSPYQVMGDITIPNDSTLSIEPGVIVEFQGHHALYVNGRLLAIGSQADTIFWTVSDTTGFYNPDTTLGGWYGIKIADTPEQNDTSKIVYCKIQYGKAVGTGWWLNAGGAICVVNFSKVYISNCLITHNSAGGSEAEIPAGGGIHLAWADAIIKNNTISHNKAIAGGAIQIHDSHPTFSNNTFIGNSAQEGGGISIGGVADISFNGDSFINNIASSHGGGIMVWGPENWSFENVTFSGNIATWGAGLGLSGGDVTVVNCFFENNKAFDVGGGIAADFCEILISNSSFINDTSQSISGAIHGWYSDIEIDDCDFLNNSAVQGGAIYTDFSTVEIDNATFAGNSANNGGAIRMWCSYLDVDSTFFQDNHVYNQGGVIDYIIDTNEFSQAYEFSLLNTKFINNSADYRCGAISIEQLNSEISLVNTSIHKCEFIENHAERIGAIMIVENISDIDISNCKFQANSSELWTGCMTISNGSSGTVSNSLFAYNSAGAGTAGAAGSSNGGSVDYINCTFAGNSSPGGGALALRKNASANIMNSIFWGNSPNQLAMNSVTDTTACNLYLNYCDLQDGQDSIIISDSVSILHWGVGNIDAQPMFEDLLNEDYSLSNISPCIGIGIDTIQIEGTWYFCPLFDILGNPRPNPTGTMPDMGAFESPLPDTSLSVENSNARKRLYSLNSYPNPFHKTTTLSYELTHAGFVEISIFSLQGKNNKIVLNEFQNIGKQEVLVDCGFLNTGVYFCVLKTNGGIDIVKMIKVE